VSIIHYLIDFILHLDKHLSLIIQDFGPWTYLLLFLIVFAETGLVVTPFLPGDSLLFAVGAFASVGALDVFWILALLSLAAVLGDSVNYAIGKCAGPQVFKNPNSKIFKKRYLEKTQAFYQKFGGKTIVLARFVPIVRTFAPFVAGVGQMDYGRFLAYNVFGGGLWVFLLVLSGYFLGNIPFVRDHFTMVIYIIIIVSLLPSFFEVWRHLKHARGERERSGNDE
jgi:membrane-associated protein